MVFRWRKRNEGFEWHTYVRTTILVRRHERRQRAEDVKAAAVFGVKKAGVKGVDVAAAALKSAQSGSLSALRWSRHRIAIGARKSAAGIAILAGKSAEGARAGWVKSRAAMAPKFAAAGAASKAGAAHVAVKLEPVRAILAQPGLQLALKLIASVALIGALIRAWQFGWDGHALVALCAAGLATALLLATGFARDSRVAELIRNGLDRLNSGVAHLPGVNRLPRRGVMLMALAVAGLVAGAAFWGWPHRPHAWPGLADLSFGKNASASRETSPASSSKNSTAGREPSVLEGSATAQTGDQLRISGFTVQLDGIEAPDAAQTCLKPDGKRWDCAASAREALSKLVKGRRVACQLTGAGNDGVRTGRCQVTPNLVTQNQATQGQVTQSQADIAAELVVKGHVFAQSGIFAAYSSQESEAFAAKIGLWAGDVLRPADWRAARWEEAKRQAPEGCPIKGQVFRKSGKIYRLPWSPDYDRARVNKAQGERWFCSESEALSAGWKKGL